MIKKNKQKISIALSIVVIVSVALFGYKMWNSTETQNEPGQNEELVTKRYDNLGQKSYEKAKPGIYQQDPHQKGKDI